MAKKRRKPCGTRSRTQAPPRASVRTAERTGKVDAEAEERSGARTARPGPRGATSTRERPAGGATPQRTRAEKKDLARRQREEIRRRVQRAQRVRQLAWVGGLAAALAVAVFFFTRPDQPSVRPDTLPGELATEAPWSANADEAAARADAIGLPSHGDTLAMHEHADVQIFVHGDPVTIPVNVGIDEADGDVESLHTHTDDGVVHIESSIVAEFTLGQFFDVWGVRLSGTCLGAYCEDADNGLRVFKDGQEVTGPVRDVVLDDRSVIVVTYGTGSELPDPIPSAFDFSTVPQ